MSGALNGTIILWDVETSARLREFEPCRAAVQIIAIAADGQQAVSASADEALAVWNLATGGLLARAYIDRPARACAISPDGTVVVAGDENGRVTSLRLESG